MAQTVWDVLHSWLEHGTRHTTPDVNIESIADVVPQMDDTDKLAVSLYAELGSPGDTHLQVVNWAQDHYTPEYPLSVANFPFLYNEDSQYDRARNNTLATLFASAARTTTVQSSDQINYNARRLLLFLNVSALSNTPSITPYLQIKDNISDNYFTIWTANVAITDLGQYVYYFSDGAAGGNFTETQPFGLPARIWRLGITHADTDSITYSVDANILL